MARRIAFKRLAAVEIDAGISHQHELHGDALRRELGFPLGRTTGRFTAVLYTGDEPDAVSLQEGSFTLYDARKAHPSRSEFRLYYDIDLFLGALPGDLLVLVRESASLHAIVARGGTRVESELLRLLTEGDHEALERFRFADVRPLGPSDASAVASAMTPTPVGDIDYPAAVGREIDDVEKAGAMPATVAMAELGRLALHRIHGPLLPDLALFHGLDAETDIYFELERRVKSVALADAVSRGGDLAEVTGFVMSMLQSRRARRGQSLQHHFAAVLRAERIPFVEQCQTEPGERPDFLVPGCAQYQDFEFPAARLRMIGCKSTARERWRQLLNEARRIPNKYLLTVDTRLTAPTVTAMEASGIRPFLPAPIVSANYGASMASRLGTVGELVQELRAII